MTEQEKRKEIAIELMKTLDIYKPYVKEFIEKGRVCFFEGFGGFWVDQEPEIESKMKEIEAKHNVTVYAITHEITDFGEMYDFLIVTNEPEEWAELVTDYYRDKIALAYVWNKDVDYDSEFGDIVVRSFGGGIMRVG